MERKTLLKIIVFFLFFNFGLNHIGQGLYWDYTTWWFDMVMHFLGGVWVAFFFIWFFSIENLPFLSRPLHITDPKLPYLAMFFVLLIGFLWEVFEFYANNYIGIYPFDIIDTSSDMFFDFFGGGTALCYFFYRIMPSKQSTV
jgi:uncharacterized membrane protein YjdF